MRRRSLEFLRCPYCGDRFRVAWSDDDDCIEYGLLCCSCFEFPIVEGVLLLSLARDSGGPENSLLPYVALQVAAIRHLQRGDVAGLKDWIRAHVPLAAALIDGAFESYLEFSAAYDLARRKATNLFLARAADLGVVGDVRARAQLAHKLRILSETSPFLGLFHHQLARIRNARLTARIAADPHAHELEQLAGYYAQRFFSPRAIATSVYLRHLPLAGRMLSVCSGHGMFENLLSISGRVPSELVCLESHWISLLVIRRIIGVDADWICHDVQFGWPFQDGAFEGVFSSTCLPEIPPQRHFIAEAVRVTAPRGWTMFDSIWTADSGAARVDPMRQYRFCQNFLDDLGACVELFRRSLPPGRVAAFDVSGSPADYLGPPTWLFDEPSIELALRAPRDIEINALVIAERDFSGFVSDASLAWIEPQRLSLSPAFDVTDDGPTLQLKRRRRYARPDFNFAPRGFGILPEEIQLVKNELRDPQRLRDLYCRGILAPLPWKFSREQRPIASYLL